MKTKEELKALRAEVETLNKKLAELSEEELSVVTGGASDHVFDVPDIGLPEYRQRYEDVSFTMEESAAEATRYEVAAPQDVTSPAVRIPNFNAAIAKHQRTEYRNNSFDFEAFLDKK